MVLIIITLSTFIKSLALKSRLQKPGTGLLYGSKFRILILSGHAALSTSFEL